MDGRGTRARAGRRRESAVELHAIAARAPRAARRPAHLVRAPPRADERFRASDGGGLDERRKAAAAETRSLHRTQPHRAGQRTSIARTAARRRAARGSGRRGFAHAATSGRRNVPIAARAARERLARRRKTKSPGARRRAAESVCGSDCAAAPFAHELKRSPATHITPLRCADPSGGARTMMRETRKS